MDGLSFNRPEDHDEDGDDGKDSPANPQQAFRPVMLARRRREHGDEIAGDETKHADRKQNRHEVDYCFHNDRIFILRPKP